MDEGKVTGINCGKAKQDILAFAKAMWKADYSFEWAAQELFQELQLVWASPKAVEFSNTYIGNFKGISTRIKNRNAQVIANAVEAFNRIASAHGASGLSTFDDGFAEAGVGGVYGAGNAYSGENSSIGLDGLGNQISLLPERNGIVGMNVSGVLDALDVFDSNLSAFYDDINAVPSSIAFYDTEGAQVGAYRSEVDRIKADVDAEVKKLREVINAAIETEQHTVQLAKQQATDILNG